MFTCQLGTLTVDITMPLLTTYVNGFWKKAYRLQGEDLCFSALRQARTPYFYEQWGVPDTLEGRFDCSVLHLSVLLRHVKGSLAQAVFNAFFSYTDLTLREIGVSDMRIGKQVKTCAKFFYGALKAYDDGLEGKANLEEALIRNLYGNTCSLWAKEVALYVRACDLSLKGQDFQKEVAWSSFT